MSGSGSLDGANDFQQRVAAYHQRVQAGNEGKPVVSPLPSMRENLRFPLRVIGAFLTGLLAVLISRYIRYHLNGGALGGEGADVAMMMDGALAAAAGFALRQIFRFEAAVFLTAFNAGVIAMVLLMHNLVHVAPGVFELAFSEAWTAQVIEQTEPNSALFMGESIPLGGGDEAAAPKMPTVRRMGQ